jgi:ABC-type cobalamin/Fe3+-siderophores transport system ATPase subunit
MEETGVWDLAGKSVTEISGGQMQRLLLARALLQIFPDPAAAPVPSRLLLLDETLSELDIAARIAADGSPGTVFTPEFFAGVFSVKAEIMPSKGFLFYDNLDSKHSH